MYSWAPYCAGFWGWHTSNSFSSWEHHSQKCTKVSLLPTGKERITESMRFSRCRSRQSPSILFWRPRWMHVCGDHLSLFNALILFLNDVITFLRYFILPLCSLQSFDMKQYTVYAMKMLSPRSFSPSKPSQQEKKRQIDWGRKGCKSSCKTTSQVFPVGVDNPFDLQ